MRLLTALVLCEYSDTVGSALRRHGFETITNDLLPTEGDSDLHIQGDCFDAMRRAFKNTDLIIMHPPCTALAVSGNGTYAKGKAKHAERVAAIEWTTKLFKAAKATATYVCMENPVGILPFKPTQYIQPWEHGHPEQKKTGLWLHNLPKLKPTNDVYDEMMKLPRSERERTWYMSPSENRGHERSKTFPGIAEALAKQFGNHIKQKREKVYKNDDS